MTTQGVFKHELGHILGLRHEHIRVSGTSCSETGVARALTAYDSVSVMHYPWCPGATNTSDLFLTARSAHGFAWVTDTASVSPTYSFNSVGGTVTAYRVEPVIDPGVAGPAPAAAVLPPPIFNSGQYIVTFAGLGGLNGNVQVVAYGGTNTRWAWAARSRSPPLAPAVSTARSRGGAPPAPLSRPECGASTQPGTSGDAAQVQTQCYSAGGVKQNRQYVGTYSTKLVRGPC